MSHGRRRGHDTYAFSSGPQWLQDVTFTAIGTGRRLAPPYSWTLDRSRWARPSSRWGSFAAPARGPDAVQHPRDVGLRQGLQPRLDRTRPVLLTGNVDRRGRRHAIQRDRRDHVRAHLQARLAPCPIVRQVRAGARRHVGRPAGHLLKARQPGGKDGRHAGFELQHKALPKYWSERFGRERDETLAFEREVARRKLVAHRGIEQGARFVQSRERWLPRHARADGARRERHEYDSQPIVGKLEAGSEEIQLQARRATGQCLFKTGWQTRKG